MFYRSEFFLKKEIKIPVFLFLVFITVAVVFGKNFYIPMSQCLFGNPTNCNWQFWQIGEVIAVSSASIIALWSGWRAHKDNSLQLQASQRPLIKLLENIKIAKGSNDDAKSIDLSIKNIGRGPAINITANFFLEGRNNALFEREYPHSINLGTGEDFHDWKINPTNMKSQVRKQLNTKESNLDGLFRFLMEKKKYLNLYVFCNDQLGFNYIFKIKLGVEDIDQSGVIGGQYFILKTMEVNKI